MRKGPFFSFFHPTLSISVSRLKSLIEVLQPASRPATRRKKKVYRSKPVVGLLLYHSISSSSTSSLLYKLLFFFRFCCPLSLLFGQIVSFHIQSRILIIINFFVLAPINPEIPSLKYYNCVFFFHPRGS
jgi:hypothetical protein